MCEVGGQFRERGWLPFSSVTVTSMWTLPEASDVIVKLQGAVRLFGYHITLGGSVLNVGHSEKDLDLFLLPMDNAKYPENMPGLMVYLEEQLGPFKELRGIAYEMRIHKQMVMFTVDGGKRIDVFVL